MCFYATWRCGLNLAASPRLMNMADVTKRMLDLLATLQAGRAFSGEELATRLEVSPSRTLRRDVERLRGYGYPWPPAPGRVAAINSRPDSGCLPLSSTTRKAWPRSSASPHLLPRLLRI